MLLRFAIRRLLAGILVLLAIAYVAFLTQDISARKRLMQAAPLSAVASEAWTDTSDLWEGFLRGDLGQYGLNPRWQHPANLRPISQLIRDASARSAVLLLLAMVLGGIIGGLLGIGAAAFRRRTASLSMLLLSILGVSTPSFVLVVLLQFGVIQFYRNTGIRLLPAGGFGFDAHMVLPVLVLAARPIAQVARLTSVHMENLINEDFVRVARSKGLTETEVWFGHILPNVTGTVLTAVASSLRFSLSSLPLVEAFFGWRGLGYYLLERIESYDTRTAVVLVVVTGLFFVVLNALADLGIRILDPRLRKAAAMRSAQMESGNWMGLAWWSFLRAITFSGLRERRKVRPLSPLPVSTSVADESAAELSRLAHSMRWGRLRAWRRAALGNPALVLGLILGLALLVAAVAGPSLAPHNPYETLSRVEVDGELVTPPVAPSQLYPLGTDTLGRDILSLLLAGASRTLVLALMAVAGRLVIGGLFGFLAGWFHDSLLDRLLMALGELVNSFPALLLATLVVYAVGVRQGLSAFVVGLLVIGWPEVMQTIRARVVSVRPLAYIEGAVAAGAGQGEILTRHVLPNIWPTMVSLAFLEMGGALMILGELGFLGVFIGGGWAAEGEERPLLYYYDIPEWGVMMANSWQSFRSYPWTMIYPALAFMAAILTFVLLGEGLRRLSEELTLSMKALFNRYTFAALAVIGVIAWWGFESTGAWARYRPLADSFSGKRAMADVVTLAGPQFEGRQMGTLGGEAAAAWIAREFEELGLITAGQDWTYFQTVRVSMPVMNEPTQVQAWDRDGTNIPLVWGADYAESPEVLNREASVARGEIIYAATMGGRDLDLGAMRRALSLSDEESLRTDRILLVDEDDIWLTVPLYALYTDPDPKPAVRAAAMLVVKDDPQSLLRRELPGLSLEAMQMGIHRGAPMISITEETADRLLAGSGHTLAELRQQKAALATGQGLWVPTGARAVVHLGAVENEEIPYRNVLAMWPGEDTALDNEMVILSAYYDGLGTWGGAMYPGANDNASGVATLLEIIRSWKEWGFKPKRTTLLVAWAGGERYQKPDVRAWLSTRPGFEDFRVLGVFEIEGVGAGEGNAPLLWRSSSERVSGMVHAAARKLGLPLADQGSGLHNEGLARSEIDLDYPRVYLGWPDADANTHLPTDAPDTLDAGKMECTGRILSLTVAVMVTDPAY